MANTTEDADLADFFHTDDDLPRRTGRTRHRRIVRPPVETLPFLERLLAPVTAVVVVIVVILLMIWINGSAPDTSDGTAAKRVVSPTTAPTHHRGTTPASTRATPPPAAVGPTHHVHGKPSRHHKSGVAAAGAAAPLVVLNNSTRTGLAHSVATQASRKGWHVSRVGNLQAVVAKTTVYYAPGDHAAAVNLAHDFGSVQRVAPYRAGHLHGKGLTLVVTRSWRL
jgi:LytR cell envelope-related transcriptional attenuator